MITRKSIYFLIIASVIIGITLICKHIVFEDLFLEKGYLDNLMAFPVLISMGFYLYKNTRVQLYPFLLLGLGNLWNTLAFALNGWMFPTNYTTTELMGVSPYYLPHSESSYVWLGDLKVLHGASIGDLLGGIGIMGIILLVIVSILRNKKETHATDRKGIETN